MVFLMTIIDHKVMFRYAIQDHKIRALMISDDNRDKARVGMGYDQQQ